jgi:hypothetical protein
MTRKEEPCSFEFEKGILWDYFEKKIDCYYSKPINTSVTTYDPGHLIAWVGIHSWKHSHLSTRYGVVLSVHDTREGEREYRVMCGSSTRLVPEEDVVDFEAWTYKP